VQFKALLIKTVLATDMSNHFEIVSTFQQKFSGLSCDEAVEEEVTHARQIIKDNAALVIQMIVKCADLGHCYARIEQHLFWSKCLEDEFFKQGDNEREANLPISPLMDRHKPGEHVPLDFCSRHCFIISMLYFDAEDAAHFAMTWFLLPLSLAAVMASKNQAGFFAVIVLPMLEVFVEGFEAARPLLEQARANVEWWKSRNETNYVIQELSTYRAAMAKTMEQRASLIDIPTDLDKETGILLPETEEEKHGSLGRPSKGVRDQSGLISRLMSITEDEKVYGIS
jgi:hypothetical protein